MIPVILRFGKADREGRVLLASAPPPRRHAFRSHAFHAILKVFRSGKAHEALEAATPVVGA